MKRVRASKSLDRFFRDKRGKVAIIQLPNTLLTVWLVLLLINFILHSPSLGGLQTAVLFAWAYVEFTSGTSTFRKALGAVVLFGIVVGYISRL